MPLMPASPSQESQPGRARGRRIADIAANDLRRRIVAGEFTENARLPRAVALMQSYGISRPSLREAYRVLEAEQLISQDPNNHWNYHVHRPSIEVAARLAQFLLDGASREDVDQVREALRQTPSGNRAVDTIIAVLSEVLKLKSPRQSSRQEQPEDPRGRLIATVRAGVASGQLQPGSRLPTEPAIRADYGATRTQVRDALLILESQGFVTVHRGSIGGATISRPGPDIAARYVGLLLQHRGVTLREFFELSGLIEVAFATAAARTRAVTPAMRKILRSETDGSTSRELTSSAIAFHESVARASGSPALAGTYVLLESVLSLAVASRFEATHDGDAAERLAAAHVDHCRLVELIEAGDAAGARLLWTRHCALQPRPEDGRVIDVFALDPELGT